MTRGTPPLRPSLTKLFTHIRIEPIDAQLAGLPQHLAQHVNHLQMKDRRVTRTTRLPLQFELRPHHTHIGLEAEPIQFVISFHAHRQLA